MAHARRNSRPKHAAIFIFRPRGCGSGGSLAPCTSTPIPLDGNAGHEHRLLLMAISSGPPLLHKATFDANSTPSWLLLPICLIGLSILNPGGAEDFIRLYL